MVISLINHRFWLLDILKKILSLNEDIVLGGLSPPYLVMVNFECSVHFFRGPWLRPTGQLRSEPDSFSVFVIGHCHTKRESSVAAVLVQSARTILFRLPPRLYRRRST